MFIVFEGGEGVGKTTQIELVEKALISKNLPFIKTREPGGTPFAEKIRSLFKEKNNEAPTPLTELYLICAARAQHVENVIKPNLNKIIICDRFLDSTYVYQHILGKIPKEYIDSPTQPILDGLIPDLTFIFYCENNKALNRIKSDANREEDRLDSMDKNAHNTIHEGYKTIFDKNIPYPCKRIPKRILIDASLSINEVFAQIKLELENHLSLKL